MTNLGFKKLTLDNWLQPDEASTSFVSISHIDGKVYPTTADERLRYILRPALEQSVPKEIRALFEVARGVLAYGYFFYPLYGLGVEQLYRVVETAVNFKCKSMRAPASICTFEKKLEYLMSENIIPKLEKSTWHALRKIRNYASHPESQMILPPGLVIDTLERIVGKINFLFKETG